MVKTEPTMMVAIRTPNAVASARPMTTGPRMSMRTRHRSSATKKAVSSQAASMYGTVSSAVEAAGHRPGWACG